MIKVNGEEVRFIQFPNGEIQIDTDSLPEKGWLIQYISFKYENDNDLIKLMFVKQFIESNYHYDGLLVIYYMPYSRMDRSENGSPFTLKYVADFINSLGFKRIKIIEPHSDVTPALVNNAESLYINFLLIEKVKEEVGFDDEMDYIMFPDLGASKRYSRMKAKNVIIGHKNRDFATGEIKGLNLISDFETSGSKVIIVDDLSSYGGTFVHSAKALRKNDFEEIYLLVAHSENSIFKGSLFDNVNKVFTTDSILTEQNYWENAKFKEKLHIFNIEEVLKW